MKESDIGIKTDLHDFVYLLIKKKTLNELQIANFILPFFLKKNKTSVFPSVGFQHNMISFKMHAF